jgi:alkaline phosphatase
VVFPFTVALGGGRKNFLGKREGGNRRDASIDLMQQWIERTKGSFVRDRAALQTAVNQDRPVLGVFADMHMTFALDRAPDSAEPTLAEMTRSAIARLSRHQDGYFLMVESGRIDHGHHDGRAAYALQEVQELSRAVEAALSLVDLSDTLILVTADHSHVFTMGGYPTRGNPILGLVRGNDAQGLPKQVPNLADDGQPYTTLGYYNGPGAVAVHPRPTPSNDPKAKQQALVPITPEETHGGEDVPLYAIGAGSNKVGGVIEQDWIYEIMVKALGMPRIATSDR